MAVIHTWTGAANNGLGNDPNNWSPVGVPATGDTANINNSATIEGPTGFRLITFNVASPNVELEDLDSATINLTSTHLTLDNLQSGSVKIGAGTLILNNPTSDSINTTSGTITVNDTTGKSSIATNLNGNPVTLVTNGGTVSYENATLAAGSFVTLNAADPGDIGNLVINNESVLEAKQATRTGITVNAGGRFIIDSPSNYTGTINYQGGRVDLPGSTTASSFYYDSKGSLLVLTDVTGVAVASLKFIANKSFQINKDATGTYISISFAPVPTIGSVQSAVIKNYTITDTTTGTTTQNDGSHYVGPVAGIWNQYGSTSPDAVNITANVPSTFIHAGPLNDSIDVSKVNGNNVLDGSTGSNFLTGGIGIDTFYIDDRAPSATIWSSIVNFHTGDNSTVFGVNVSDFTLTWLNNQGAPGHTGLTGVFTNKATGGLAAVTLAGYSQADLTNGRLTLAYGHTADIPGLPGSDYLLIHGN